MAPQACSPTHSCGSAMWSSIRADGRWHAGTLADAAALAIETGQGADRGLAAGGLAWLAAVQGREQECRDRAAEALRLADRLGVGSRPARASTPTACSSSVWGGTTRRRWRLRTRAV